MTPVSEHEIPLKNDYGQLRSRKGNGSFFVPAAFANLACLLEDSVARTTAAVDV